MSEMQSFSKSMAIITHKAQSLSPALSRRWRTISTHCRPADPKRRSHRRHLGQVERPAKIAHRTTSIDDHTTSRNISRPKSLNALPERAVIKRTQSVHHRTMLRLKEALGDDPRHRRLENVCNLHIVGRSFVCAIRLQALIFDVNHMGSQEAAETRS
jgi:hypothetical protein